MTFEKVGREKEYEEKGKHCLHIMGLEILSYKQHHSLSRDFMYVNCLHIKINYCGIIKVYNISILMYDS